MKNLFFLALLITTSAFNIPTNQSGKDIIGRWMSTDNNLEIEIFKTGNEFKARVIWFNGREDKSRPLNLRCDVKNPDEHLQKRKVIGMEVMYGLFYNENNDDWEDGRIYDASSGKSWNANVQIMKNGNLRVKAFWHVKCFGKNIFFKRVL